jgi:hypothetical protein
VQLLALALTQLVLAHSDLLKPAQLALRLFGLQQPFPEAELFPRFVLALNLACIYSYFYLIILPQRSKRE